MNSRNKPNKGTRPKKSPAEAIQLNMLKKMYAIFEEPIMKAIRAQNRWNIEEAGIIDA